MNLLKRRNLLKGFLPIYALQIMHTKAYATRGTSQISLQTRYAKTNKQKDIATEDIW